MTYLIGSIPLVTERFKQYLIGLYDGDVSFQAYVKKGVGCLKMKRYCSK